MNNIFTADIFEFLGNLQFNIVEVDMQNEQVKHCCQSVVKWAQSGQSCSSSASQVTQILIETLCKHSITMIFLSLIL